MRRLCWAGCQEAFVCFIPNCIHSFCGTPQILYWEEGGLPLLATLFFTWSQKTPWLHFHEPTSVTGASQSSQRWPGHGQPVGRKGREAGALEWGGDGPHRLSSQLLSLMTEPCGLCVIPDIRETSQNVRLPKGVRVYGRV